MLLELSLYVIGMTLLYLPPILIYSYKDIINNSKLFKNTKYIIILSLALTLIMVYALPQAWGAFIFYYCAFHFIRFSYNKLFSNAFESFSIAVYACFAISVLWEIPIQIMIPQNPFALALSSLKALGIIYLFLSLRDKGWRFALKTESSYIFISCLLVGLFLTIALMKYPTTDPIMFVSLHLYRISWLLLFLSMIAETFYYKVNKSLNQL